ncbi:MinD-like ATPase involved in chromosome partitioning or flagellar assembly [Modestobacter versicolor]|uniref:MinD-like ATPase involved in chromosome partitioning or flagellar assembly n=2 Tax=Modestobacter versicolor TaxID=429133 RepID=A0A839YB49_9ACTN|nr:MinD-like ATPase involved in chromosome partitioning or flagellar assembly [Modestobacter versicolor]
MSDRQSDREDEQRPEGDGSAAAPWSAEPVRRTDGERWDASVESWSAGAPKADDDGGQRPSWEVPQEPTGNGAPTGSTATSATPPAQSWQQPSWATGGQPWAPPASPPAPQPSAAQPSAAQPSWGAPPAPEQPADRQPAHRQADPPTSSQPAPSQPAPSQPAPAQPAPSWRPAEPGPAGGQQPWGQPQGPAGPQQAPPPSPYGPQNGRPAGPVSLTSQTLLRQQDDVPRTGWRKFVHKATGGAYNPGLSQAEVEHRALVARVTTPVRGSNRIAVVSLKGGIGKTTTTSCLGLTLAHHRGDRVVAVDANPDAGTLAERLTNVTDVTVRDLLANVGSIRSFTDVSAYTSLAGRLQVLASDQDPALSEAFSEEEYTTVADILARYFNIILTDSGTGLLHSAMSGTLAIADSLVVVGAPSVDGASRASKTLDWLIAHGHEELVARSVAVISSVRPNTGDVDMQVLRDHFAARCRAVIEIPYDPHLVTGGLIDLERIAPTTRRAYLELSAAVADGFALPPLQRAPAPQA